MQVLIDAIIGSMDWNIEDVKIMDVGKLELMFGHAILYKFDVQMGESIRRSKIMEFSRDSTQEIGGEPENGLMKETEQFAPNPQTICQKPQNSNRHNCNKQLFK